MASAAVALGASGLVLISGCTFAGGSGANTSPAAAATLAPAAVSAVDPLVGGPPIPPASGGPGPQPPSLGPAGTPPPGFTPTGTGTAGAAGTPGSSGTARGGLPTGSLNTPTSTAILASGVPRLEGGQDLHISGGAVGASFVGGPQPAGVPGTPVPGTSAVPGAWNGPPAGDAVPPGAGSGGPAGAFSTGSTAGQTFEQLQAQLAQRGVTWQRLDMANGDWAFQCSIADRQNPNKNWNFVARGTPSPVAAIRSVLDQIDRFRQ